MYGHRLPIALCIACTLVVTVPTTPAADPLLDGAVATLAINDLSWLEREVAGFASTAGTDPRPLRDRLAQTLFLSRSLDGIDPSRPALIAWREGAAPLLAVIPLADRRRFAQDFGAIRGTPPLIRVGERNGTSVYTQNTQEGLYEYRLLVQDDTAYLARTPEECRALAARSWRVGSDLPPLVVTASGAMFTSVPPTGAGDGTPLQIARLLVGAGWNDLVAQVASVRVECLPAGIRGIRVQATVKAEAHTTLARWVSLQKNAGSRLLPAIQGPDSIVAVYGQVDWQGQLDRLGQQAVPAARVLAGDAWTAPVEEAWRSLWQVADRCGGFAMAYDAPKQGQAAIGKLICDQPRAAEYTALQRLIAEAVGRGLGASFADATIAGLTGYRTQLIGSESVQIADAARLYHVSGSVGAVDAVAESLIGHAAVAAAPEGQSGILGLYIDVTRMLQGEKTLDQDAARLPQVRVEAVLKSTPAGDLTGEIILPLSDIAVLMRDTQTRLPLLRP